MFELKQNGVGYDVWLGTKRVGMVARNSGGWFATTARGKLLATNLKLRRDALALLRP